MSPYEVGKVSAFLLRYRKIEERSERRPIQREEKDLAALLREAGLESLQYLQEMLNGHGFDLVTLTSFDVRGVAPGSRVHLLVRQSNAECLSLDANRMIERMDSAPGRATVAKIWFTQLWLLQLDLLYTARDRAPSERNLWLEASFTKGQLVQCTRDHINGYVRRLNPAEVGDSEVYRVLTAEKGSDLERYVNRFLDLMVDAGMLDKLDDNVYRQSLLSAVEMQQNYERVLAPLMLGLGQEPVIGTAMAPTAHALLTGETEQTQEGPAV